jgi:arylsulfatase
MDFDASSSNGALALGAQAEDEGLRALRAVERDRDASTLVVRPGPWTDAPDGYRWPT